MDSYLYIMPKNIIYIAFKCLLFQNFVEFFKFFGSYLAIENSNYWAIGWAWVVMVHI